ncbi:MAG: 3-deoxy-D-manno-octulosonic acid transferase [Pseudomonadota bacterium]|nr:3-deoxy-D-manno-octulosonic acid transferase [Pseudomonadota bacterium]
MFWIFAATVWVGLRQQLYWISRSRLEDVCWRRDVMIRLYAAATVLALPLVRLIMWRRLKQGKEDGQRLGERFGLASAPRPIGPIIWVHAASVGETVSVMPLVGRLLADFPLASVLITTVTRSSAEMLEKDLSDRLLHQFVPIDRPGEINSFLDYWNPDAAIWIESELWPNLLTAAQGRGVPSVLVQGRISEKSFRRWWFLRALVRPLLAGFSRVLVQTAGDADRFRTLGALEPVVTGTLKYSSPPLKINKIKLAQINSRLENRSCWVAASVHPGEFSMLCEAHAVLRERFPNLLTIIVPRHPIAGASIEKTLLDSGILVAVRSREEEITEETEIYIGDSFGELGIFYDICPIAFIGGSLIPHGGQNPLEAIRLGCVAVVGPHMFNFSQIVSDLASGGALVSVGSGVSLAHEISKFLESPEILRELFSKQKAVVSARDSVLDDVYARVVEAIPESIRLSWS